MNLLVKEKYYRGYWIAFYHEVGGWRWNIENRAGNVVLKGTHLSDSQVGSQMNAEIAIDLMIDDYVF